MGVYGQSITGPLCPSFLTTLFTCSSVRSPLATAHPRHTHLPWCSSSRDCMGYCLWHFTMGCRGASAQSMSTISFDLGVSSAVCQFSCSPLFCLCGVVAGSSLTMFPPRCHYFGWKAQPFPALFFLEPDGATCDWLRAPPASLHQCHCPANTLAWTSRTIKIFLKVGKEGCSFTYTPNPHFYKIRHTKMHKLGFSCLFLGGWFWLLDSPGYDWTTSVGFSAKLLF